MFSKLVPFSRLRRCPILCGHERGAGGQGRVIQSFHCSVIGCSATRRDCRCGHERWAKTQWLAHCGACSLPASLLGCAPFPLACLAACYPTTALQLGLTSKQSLTDCHHRVLPQAQAAYGNVDVYTSSFRPMRNTIRYAHQTVFASLARKLCCCRCTAAVQDHTPVRRAPGELASDCFLHTLAVATRAGRS